MAINRRVDRCPPPRSATPLYRKTPRRQDAKNSVRTASSPDWRRGQSWPPGALAFHFPSIVAPCRCPPGSAPWRSIAMWTDALRRDRPRVGSENAKAPGRQEAGANSFIARFEAPAILASWRLGVSFPVGISSLSVSAKLGILAANRRVDRCPPPRSATALDRKPPRRQDAKKPVRTATSPDLRRGQSWRPGALAFHFPSVLAPCRCPPGSASWRPIAVWTDALRQDRPRRWIGNRQGARTPRSRCEQLRRPI